MNGSMIAVTLAIALGGIGTWLLLPHGHGHGRPRLLHGAGLLLVLIAVGVLGVLTRYPAPFLKSLFFYAFAFTSVMGGVLMITSVNPVYSALWFASVVLSSAGLFLLAGAQFLAAATVIIYAGAIIVTFLFVIMLAQASGQAVYDRSTRMPARATLISSVLLWALLYCVFTVDRPGRGDRPDTRPVAMDNLAALVRLSSDEAGVNRVIAQAVPATARITISGDELPADWPDGVPPPHVAGLGGTLFTDHLVAVEIAGILLFVALVAAAAVAAPRLANRSRAERS